MTAAIDRLGELWAKVDAFFARASAAHASADGITCHTGCDDCCKRRLTVTRVEGAAIERTLEAFDEDAIASLANRLASDDESACAALIDGRCAIYSARPIVCRTHGLAVRFREPADDRTRLPTLPALPALDACPRNFRGRSLEELPASSVLDQVTVSTILGAIEAAHVDALGSARGVRVDLAALLRQKIADLPTR